MSAERANSGPVRSDRPHRGFTLIELVAALPAVALIAGVVGAALVLVARSASPPEDDRARAFNGAAAARGIASDLTEALAFSQMTATVIEFRVPDRTGNGREDTIRYSWSGTPGDPLLYTLNRQPAVPLLADMHLVRFTPEITSDVLDPLDEELAVLAYHDQAPDSHTHDYAIATSDWCAQCFTPDLPLGTSKWTIKRVRFMVKREGTDLSGVIGVRIETASLGPMPTGIVLEQGTVAETSLDEAFGWIEVDFTALNDLDPLDGLCLVLSHAAGDDKSAKVIYEHGGDPMTSGTYWLKSSNGGVSWSSVTTDKDMRFYILGTYDSWVPTAAQYVVGVNVELQAGPSSPAMVTCMAAVANPVEVGP